MPRTKHVLYPCRIQVEHVSRLMCGVTSKLVGSRRTFSIIESSILVPASRLCPHNLGCAACCGLAQAAHVGTLAARAAQLPGAVGTS